MSQELGKIEKPEVQGFKDKSFRFPLSMPGKTRRRNISSYMKNTGGRLMRWWRNSRVSWDV